MSAPEVPASGDFVPASGPGGPGEQGGRERVRRRVLRALAIACLLCGLGAAAVVWQRAGAAPEASGYQVIDGVAYPLPVEDTKAYARRMAVFGGKALLAADAFLDFLGGLSRSRTVAALLALAGAGGGLCLWRAADRPAIPDEDDDAAEGDGNP
jgi:hypothetical protein